MITDKWTKFEKREQTWNGGLQLVSVFLEGKNFSKIRKPRFSLYSGLTLDKIEKMQRESANMTIEGEEVALLQDLECIEEGKLQIPEFIQKLKNDPATKSPDFVDLLSSVLWIRGSQVTLIHPNHFS
jgi:hypothetical protein